MIIVYVWRSSRSSIIPAGHASLVVCPEDRSKADTVCTWFGGAGGGSSGSAASSSWRNGSGSSRAGAGQAPANPLDEWGANFINANNYNMKDKVTRFANQNPNDPIAQRAAMDAFNTIVYPPNEAVYIRSISDADSYVGLSEDSICQWWGEFTNRENRYHLLRQNCSTITAGALIAGGGTGYASTPTGSAIFWSPDKAVSFAKSVKEEIDKEQAKRVAGARVLDRLVGEAPVVGPAVWTRTEWYEASEESVGWYARRYSELKDIDEQLDFYHNRILTDEEVTADFKSESIIRMLGDIEGVLSKILSIRSRSKRTAAFGILGSQCRAKKQVERDAIAERVRERERQHQRREDLRQPYLDRQLKLQLAIMRLPANKSLGDMEKVAKMREIQQELREIKEQLALM